MKQTEMACCTHPLYLVRHYYQFTVQICHCTDADTHKSKVETPLRAVFCPRVHSSSTSRSVFHAGKAYDEELLPRLENHDVEVRLPLEGLKGSPIDMRFANRETQRPVSRGFRLIR
ncbi:hypothetical protein GCU68_16765 (plasmid) [Natronorubrum aibiense]|uniref:Uncharacterized protein n=1 Tax=Natronorubrum aibiense TaxID=348826 RepID=A0A5P9P7X8_9EURY|nr:hypothetical protein GCU68_16765 [Natronorubrum aibiense]